MNRPKARGVPVNGVRLYVETAGAGPPLVLLHGFTGSAATWARLVRAADERFSTIALDLLGHGRSDAPADPGRYAIERGAADVIAVLDRLGVGRAGVLGYSMGGRLALYLATAAPERVAALVVESASPGIGEDAARRARAAQDAALAESIERDGVRAFADRWERQPLFATQLRLPAADREGVRAERLTHPARGLAGSLRGMGQGAQPALHDRLTGLRVPALIVAGALDAAYCRIARDMAGAIPAARLAVVPEAGHAVHLEQPDAFHGIVLEFLSEVTTSSHTR
jgi:2-succinyl-6-hydroxy-2,4-cyclohexadiene-1-carboxylate synthase